MLFYMCIRYTIWQEFRLIPAWPGKPTGTQPWTMIVKTGVKQ